MTQNAIHKIVYCSKKNIKLIHLSCIPGKNDHNDICSQ